ncbi:MAG: isocitrate lyase/phosphoenolpyruvate mutase family protein, partial [Alphaproteobacteria bacterium]
IEEGVGKMKAALAGRQDSSLVIAGRTGAAQITDFDDAIKRVRAYEAAGVDAVFLSGIKTSEQVEQVAAAVSLPIMLGGSGAGFDRAHLAANNVRIALQGHQPFMAAVKATHDTLKALRDGVKPADIEGTASGDFMKAAMRDADYKGNMKEFLGG